MIIWQGYDNLSEVLLTCEKRRIWHTKCTNSIGHHIYSIGHHIYMKGRKIISILTILFLLSLMNCPLMANPITKTYSHDCSGKTEKKDQKQHFCCDQQAITAKDAFQKTTDSVAIVAQLPSGLALKPNFVETIETAFCGPPASKDLLTKLSILRI